MHPDGIDALECGRTAYASRSWSRAYDALTAAHRQAPLGASDVELLANAAYMLGRDDEWTAGLARAHHLHLEAGDGLRAVRCAFWIGIDHMLRGRVGQATGWLGRAQRLLPYEGGDCAERGYLLLPAIFRHESAGEWSIAAEVADEAAAIGERFGEHDLVALARQAQGGLLTGNGHVEEGLALLDEAMVAVTTQDLSPIVAGLVYCGVILGCREAFEVGRAREWTAALGRWCDDQPDLVAFTGRCRIHRAEILQLGGDWTDALDEATRASDRLAAGFNETGAAEALYRCGELHRLRGELELAETAFAESSRLGREPQPGLALLRLAQGRPTRATAAIRRALGETTLASRRAPLLAAAVEIHIAAKEVDAARDACSALEALVGGFGSELLAATAAHARGAVELAAGHAESALVVLRQAIAIWQALGAPYESARSRELAGLACRALGDQDGAKLELLAARLAYERLGAKPDLDRVAARPRRGAPARHGLTVRELEVLRLVASGKSNRVIADELGVSVRTVDRHVSNIFAKLGVSSRAAATAFAYEHDLV